jgi:hypothetical protein
MILKRAIIVMALSYFGLCTWANDTHISFSAGAIGFYNEKVEDPQISLRDETISIEMLSQSVSYKVDYVFYNDGQALEYDIGFPVLNNSTWDEQQKKESDRRIDLMNFQTSVNGSETPFEKVRGSSDGKIASWYTKKVKFEGRAETKVSLSYSSPYGYGSGFQNYVEYYYGSARTWKGPIANLRIVLTNHSNFVVKQFENQVVGHLPEVRIKGDATTTVEYKEVKPDLDATIRFIGYQERLIGMNYDELQSELQRGRLTQDGLLFYNARQLRLLRNLIYALRGYIFKDKELQKFFTDNASIYNYKPQFDNVDSKFRFDEKDNIALISSLERVRSQN